MKLLNARKKLVTLAVASTVAAGAAVMSAPAQAMNLSQDGVGQVLLFPYYTVKNGYDTIFSVVNTSNRTVVFKVRWREALNSREVRDFNVIMSPYDVWTAGLTVSGDGALVRTFDKTCTSPILPTDTTGGRSIAFTNAAFSGTDPAFPEFLVDGGGTSMSRVQEGYFEIIPMTMSVSDGSGASTNVVEWNAKHVSGTPRDCSKVDTAMSSIAQIATDFPAARFGAPGNVLKGAVSYIDVATGKALDASPTTVEDWVTAAGSWTVANNIFPAGNQGPNLSNGDAGATINWLQNGVAGTDVTLGSAEHAVTGLLMSTQAINEYTANGAGTFTDWVLTFPTKHHYADLGYAADNAIPPFTQNFNFDTDGSPLAGPYSPRGRACDPITLPYWNREEAGKQSGTVFSPAVTPGLNLCYETNVISFNGSNVFGTGTNHVGFSTTDVGTSGWARIEMSNASGAAGEIGAAPALGAGPVVYGGLPAIGFAAIVRNNASEAGNNRNYASGQPHSFVGGKP